MSDKENGYIRLWKIAGVDMWENGERGNVDKRSHIWLQQRQGTTKKEMWYNGYGNFGK